MSSLSKAVLRHTDHLNRSHRIRKAHAQSWSPSFIEFAVSIDHQGFEVLPGDFENLQDGVELSPVELTGFILPGFGQFHRPSIYRLLGGPFIEADTSGPTTVGIVVNIQGRVHQGQFVLNP